MMTKEQHEEYDRAALRVGVTPVYEEDGLIMVFGDIDDGEGYTIWKGRCVGVFMGWGLAGPMVVGFPGALFKKFKSVDAARRAWVNGPTREPDWVTPRPRAPILTTAVIPRECPPSSSAVSLPPGTSATSATYVSARAEDRSPTPVAKSLQRQHRPMPQQPALPQSAITKSAVATPAITQPAAVRSPESQIAVQSTDKQVGRHHAHLLPTPARVAKTQPSAHRAQPATPSPAVLNTPRTSVSSFSTTNTSSIIVPEGRAYVVVLGDTPGICMDKITAYTMAGNHPGRKVRRFDTLEEAQEYFLLQETRGRTGTPVFLHELPK